METLNDSHIEWFYPSKSIRKRFKRSTLYDGTGLLHPKSSVLTRAPTVLCCAANNILHIQCKAVHPITTEPPSVRSTAYLNMVATVDTYAQTQFIFTKRLIEPGRYINFWTCHSWVGTEI